jgi:DNA-binding response OmpR family regulator
MANERVLVIDDDRAVHTFLKAVFGKAGYKVYTALDALQGPMAARQFSPDLIVLDLAMPGGGGPAVLQRLRTMQGMMQIPVLVYSGLGQERVEALVPPAPDIVYVAKPGTPEELLQAAQSLLGSTPS